MILHFYFPPELSPSRLERMVEHASHAVRDATGGKIEDVEGFIHPDAAKMRVTVDLIDAEGTGGLKAKVEEALHRTGFRRVAVRTYPPERTANAGRLRERHGEPGN